MAFSAKVNVGVTVEQTTSADLQTATAPMAIRKTLAFTEGVGALQANKVWSDTRTINASSSETLDLSGALTNIFGASAVFAEVKAIYIFAAPGNTNNVHVSAATASPNTAFVTWVTAEGGGIVIRPGGVFLLAAADATGYAVTATTGDLLTVANSSSGTSVTYDIVVIGN
jgi:hypothetical protein